MRALLPVLAWLAPAVAAAQEPPVTVGTGQESLQYDSPRSHASSWLLLPDDAYEVGGEVTFVTARAAPLGHELRFTDVGLTRLHARLGIGGVAEVVAGGTFLIKQPSYASESPWQSALLGARLGLGTRLAANLMFEGGPLLADAGHYGTATAQLEGKTSVHETLAFSGAVGASATQLRGVDDPWLVEVGLRAQALLRVPNDAFGMWVGVDLGLPVAHRADRMPFDPQVRLGFHAGVVYALVEDWDLYADVAVIDRGEAEDPTTTLPILDGGFDQQQVVFGVIRRFAVDEDTLLMSL